MKIHNSDVAEGKDIACIIAYDNIGQLRSDQVRVGCNDMRLLENQYNLVI